MKHLSVTPDEQARIDHLVLPGSRYLAEVRAAEFMAVGMGQLEEAEQYHRMFEHGVAGLRKLLVQWQGMGRFPTAQRVVRELLESYA